MAKAQGHITVRRRPKDGEQGEVGISYRVSFWQSGKKYHYDLNLTGGATERIIDICVNKPLSLIGDSGFKAYQCIRTHTSSDSIPLGDANYWTAVNNFQPLVSPLILASKIVADFIDVDTLYVKHLNAADGTFKGTISVYNSSGTLIAKLGDVTYPLWLGGTTAANAVTKVKADGELITSKIKATGGSVEDLTTQRLRNPFGTITDSFTPIDDDNVVSDVIGGGSFRYAYSLDWTVKSSGRRQTIIGAVSITAPTGKWFYENGRKYSEFNSSYECSEMIGYGDDNNFWGWIVVRRTLFSTNYNFGREVTPLAMGRVNGLSASASFTLVKYTNKDDAKVGANNVMAVSHTGTTGHYYLYVPRSWFTSANYIGVHLTGYGYVDGSTSSICNCGVAGIVATTRSGYNVWRIEIVVNDDASPNDGCFFFQLYNMAQWDD